MIVAVHWRMDGWMDVLPSYPKIEIRNTNLPTYLRATYVPIYKHNGLHNFKMDLLES